MTIWWEFWRKKHPKQVSAYRGKPQWLLSFFRATTLRPRLPPPSHLPSLGILPAHINRVVQMQQQPFSSIQKSQTKEIVIDKRSHRIYHHIRHKRLNEPAPLAFSNRMLRAQRGISVHMLD